MHSCGLYVSPQWYNIKADKENLTLDCNICEYSPPPNKKPLNIITLHQGVF